MTNESLLQIKTQPDVYVKIFQDIESRREHVGSSDVYWSLLPLYGVARCPYCNAVYTEKMDTYTLRPWVVWGADGLRIFRPTHKSHCSHFVYAQSFINLHGIMPQTSDTELSRTLSLTSEVPHIVPFLLESDLETHSVLHSLPICRIEGDRFVPRYTLSMVTMFAPEPEPVRKELGKWGADMESWRSFLTFPPRSDYEDWYDLEPSLCRPLADLHVKNRQQPKHLPKKATIGRPFRNRLSPFSGRAPSCRWPSGAKRKNEPPFSFPFPQPERFVAWRSVFDLPARIGENRHPLF